MRNQSSSLTVRERGGVVWAAAAAAAAGALGLGCLLGPSRWGQSSPAFPCWKGGVVGTKGEAGKVIWLSGVPGGELAWHNKVRRKLAAASAAVIGRPEPSGVDGILLGLAAKRIAVAAGVPGGGIRHRKAEGGACSAVICAAWAWLPKAR